MNTYIKFIITTFFKSFIFVFLIIFSLVFILNILSELDFFRNIKVEPFFPIYISILNSPSLIFEMFPFIFLISTQVFFINLFSDNQIEIFKYSGLKNSKILLILSIISFLMGVFIITFFYNFSSNLKNFYLEEKTKFTLDGKYLAVITNNGLWIKDVVENKINIINASKIDKNFLIVCQADAYGRIARSKKTYPQADYLWQAYVQAKNVAVQDIINDGAEGEQISIEFKKYVY